MFTISHIVKYMKAANTCIVFYNEYVSMYNYYILV